jgi:hypothetical protein
VSGRCFLDGYPPLAYCRGCGRDLSGETLFDHHRVGVHEYMFAEGLRRDPPVDDGRRCFDENELRELGLRPMADEEIRASSRHSHRTGLGVELWVDAAVAERLRAAFPKPRVSDLRSRVEATGEHFAIDEPPAA